MGYSSIKHVASNTRLIPKILQLLEHQNFLPTSEQIHFLLMASSEKECENRMKCLIGLNASPFPNKSKCKRVWSISLYLKLALPNLTLSFFDSFIVTEYLPTRARHFRYSNRRIDKAVGYEMLWEMLPASLTFLVKFLAKVICLKPRDNTNEILLAAYNWARWPSKQDPISSRKPATSKSLKVSVS